MEFTTLALKACIIFTLQHLLEEWKSQADPENMVNVNGKKSNYSSTPLVLDGKQFFPVFIMILNWKGWWLQYCEFIYVEDPTFSLYQLSAVQSTVCKHANIKASYHLKCINLIQVLKILVSSPHRTKSLILTHDTWNCLIIHFQMYKEIFLK